MDGFERSPDGTQRAVLHSSPYVLSQLAVQPSAGGAPRELTDTMKPAFTAHDWIAPKIVEVKSSHGAGTIYAKYRSEEHTSELQSLMRISYAVFCLKKKKKKTHHKITNNTIYASNT